MSRTKQHFIGLLQRGNTISRKAVPAQPDGIQSIHARTIPTGRPHERRQILAKRATAPHHGIGTDADELMNARQTANDGMIADRDMSGQTRRVGENEMVAQMAVMRDMDV